MIRRLIEELGQPPRPLSRDQKRLFWILTACVALTRWWAMSKTLWDWDEALFVLAIRDYDVSQHHPHPPGFPLFIGLAKIVYAFVGNEFLSLQLISVVLSMLLLPAVFFFAREARFGYSIAVLGGLFCAFFSNVWFFGGTAFSDLPSIVLATVSAALLLRGCRSTPSYFAGTLLLAISCGFRPQNILIGLAPGIIATAFRLNRRWWQIVAAALLGTAIVAGSYAGAVKATGSAKAYFDTLDAHQDYIAKKDSFRNPERPSLAQISEDFFVQPFSSIAISYLLAALAIAGIALSPGRRSPVVLTLLTFLPVAIAAWLFLDHLSVKRFSIGYAPMLALLGAFGLVEVSRRLRLGVRGESIAGAVVVAALIAYTVPAIYVARTTEAPPYAAMKWVRQNLAPKPHRLFLAEGVRHYGAVFLPGLPYSVVVDDRSVPMRGDDLPAFIVMEGASDNPGAINFLRPRRRIWAVVRHRYFEMSIIEMSRSARFGEGWHEAENTGAAVWRWMGRRSVTDLPPVQGPVLFGVRFDVPEDALPGPPPVVTIALDGKVVEAIVVRDRTTSRLYELPPAPKGARLTIETSRVVNPKLEGISNDSRDLGLVLTSLQWAEKR